MGMANIIIIITAKLNCSKFNLQMKSALRHGPTQRWHRRR